jgi:hypothetical protein
MGLLLGSWAGAILGLVLAIAYNTSADVSVDGAERAPITFGVIAWVGIGGAFVGLIATALVMWSSKPHNTA